MTYLQFHLVFILPPILLLAWALRRSGQPSGRRGRSKMLPLLSIVLIAFLYTTPWDNYLVKEGIWSYGVDRVIGTIGYVPVEEYLFFVLQPLLTGLWLYFLMRGREGESNDRTSIGVGIGIGAAWVLVALLGAWFLRTDETRYLGLILVWAGPVLAGQWLYGWRRYLPLTGVISAAIAVPTVYLWIADRVAIGSGIWSISERYTTGLHLLGLPIEEAVFFLLTNVLVVQGLILFLHPPSRR